MEYEYNDQETVRMHVEHDQEPYDVGDMFSDWDMPDATPEERKTAKQEFLENLYNEGGPWGFMVEVLCPHCKAWSLVDSCWGFDSYDHCFDSGKESMVFAAGEIVKG